MAFLDKSKANYAFKALLGKAHTSNGRELSNEAIASGIILSASRIFAQSINSTPGDSSNAGIVSDEVVLTLEAIAGSDTQTLGTYQAYRTKLGGSVPASLVGKINPLTGAVYTGTDYIGNIIPQSFGDSFRPRLYSDAAATVEIPPSSSADWFMDCYAGIVVQEGYDDGSAFILGSNGRIRAYIYIGTFVSDALGGSGEVNLFDGNGTTVEVTNVGGTAGYAINLGGPLTQNTTIDGAYSLSLGSGGNELTGFSAYMKNAYAVLSNKNSGETLESLLEIDSIFTPSIAMRVSDSVSFYDTSVSVGSGQIQANSNNPTFAGIVYQSDHSANYTDRSLVDKEYVDVAVMSNTVDIFAGNAIDVAFNGTNGYTVALGGQIYSNTVVTGNNNSLLFSDVITFGVDANSSINLTAVTGSASGNITNGAGFISLSASDLTDTSTIEMNSNNGRITTSSSFSNFRGLEYDIDYSANYTNRSLVDKEYVDNAAYSAGTAGLATASNGLTKVGQDIQLGGTLSSAVSIDGNSNQFAIANNFLTLASVSFQVDSSQIVLSSSNDLSGANANQSFSNSTITMTSSDGVTENISISLDYSGGAVLQDDRTTPAGWEYAVDYSATYTTRSLVDKGYVDNNAWKTQGTTTLLGNAVISGDSNTYDVTFNSLDQFSVSSENNITITTSNGEAVFGNIDQQVYVNAASQYIRLLGDSGPNQYIQVHATQGIDLITNSSGADIDISAVNAVVTIGDSSLDNIQVISDGANDGIVVTLSGSHAFEYAADYSTNYTDRSLVDKAYVDSVAAGLDPKESVRVATTNYIILSGLQTIDGVTLNDGDRVLVKDQGTAGEANGIYDASTGVWTRSSDFDGSPSNEVSSGAFTFVEEGTTYTGTGWVLATNDPITLGTTSLLFVQFSSTGIVTASNGLTKNVNDIQLGGTLTDNVNISGANAYSMTFDDLTAFNVTSDSGVSIVNNDNSFNLINATGTGGFTIYHGASGSFSMTTNASATTAYFGHSGTGDMTIQQNGSAGNFALRGDSPGDFYMQNTSGGDFHIQNSSPGQFLIDNDGGGDLLITQNSGNLTITNNSDAFTLQNNGTGAFTITDNSGNIDITSTGTISFVAADTFSIDGSVVTLVNALTSSTAGYDIVVRNTVTGVLEKIDGTSLTGSTPTIADKNLTPSAGTNGNGQYTGLTITYTPSSDSYVEVLVNGIGIVLGTSSASGDGYFAAPGSSGILGRAIADIQAGDEFYWNSIIADFSLDSGDSIDFLYNV